MTSNLTIRNTIRKVLSKKITALQKDLAELKVCITNNNTYIDKEWLSESTSLINAAIKRSRRYAQEAKRAKNKLSALHGINWMIKYPINPLENCLFSCESQIVLHYLRLEVTNLYQELHWVKEEICYQRPLAVPDGTIKSKIEFLYLNIFQNSRRKLLRKIYKLEEAIKFVKLSLKGAPPSKKPLTFKRKIRKLWRSLNYK